MSLVAHSLPSLPVRLAAAAALPARGFVELDERVTSGAGGVAVVRASSRESGEAIAAHLARRARVAGMFAIEAKARRGAPLWRDVASRLGIGGLPNDPAHAADAIARAAAVRRALIVGAMPRAGTWDRTVAAELASLRGGAAVVLVMAGFDATEDLAADVYEIGATLDPVERQRWWAALGESAQERSPPTRSPGSKRGGRTRARAPPLLRRPTARSPPPPSGCSRSRARGASVAAVGARALRLGRRDVRGPRVRGGGAGERRLDRH